ncbi:hypothetical protein KP509_18G063700 [Ceratopteris richardii]|uniref:VOC domain-containing protein n=1 Tax=Ceratopteris richardii TaxID=49495 RepID=A0A8T2SU11_CERRI|nr:hypothetical protein KP509_18G063700 [Ceratopteris richardii]
MALASVAASSVLQPTFISPTNKFVNLRQHPSHLSSGWKGLSSPFFSVNFNTKEKGSCIKSSSVPADVIESSANSEDESIGFIGIHHVGVLCENLERSLEFYCGLLGLETCNLRPNDRLRYRGAWLWVGNQMIHLMELPNPDPVIGRPAHGGEDRHICVSVKNPMRLKSVLEDAGIPYTMSKSGRPVIFTRDPDGNALECQPSYMHETPKN